MFMFMLRQRPVLVFVVVLQIPSSNCPKTLPCVLATMIVTANSFLYPVVLVTRAARLSAMREMETHD